VKFYFPNNVFARLIACHLPEGMKQDVSFISSSVISKELASDKEAVGLIPVMDIINHQDLQVSAKTGISFESQLCNSYIYFNKGQREIKDVYLAGDISSQEVILSKIIFKEQYDSAVEIHLLSDNKLSDKNLILAGDRNFNDNMFANGISFAEEMIENLNLPYVNYVFASMKKENIELFHEAMTGMDELIDSGMEEYKFDNSITGLSADYIKTNISSLIVNFDQQDLEGLEQLVRLPYFYGIIKDILEIKFVR
jgi:hypothetical protein